MALDESKLENVLHKDGKLTARCPACFERGSDSKGEHLVVYENGVFGCVVHQEDEEHRKRIYAFVGENAPSAKEASRFELRKFKFKPLPNWNPYE